MLTIAEHLEQKFGAVPDIMAICPCCKAPAALFAITRDNLLRWRCGHCRIADERAAAPTGNVLTWDDVRGERSLRLTQCDWTQLPDAQAIMADDRRTAWLTYRQALRDITSQSCEPADVVWPLQPSD